MTSESHDEREHEVRAALFGIEASAQGPSEHPERLAAQQVDGLAQALAQEVRRLKALLEGRHSALTTFDLGNAIGPMIACVRACGVDVRCSVPPGTAVVGDPARTAQVVLGLLHNARIHASGSPVDVRTAQLNGGIVALYVEDRGDGLTSKLRARVFERGVCGDASRGSGLGLVIARRVMEEQGGTITARCRPGGGASFVLYFRHPGKSSLRRHRCARQTRSPR
jgi:signal transduction histidine kinase